MCNRNTKLKTWQMMGTFSVSDLLGEGAWSGAASLSAITQPVGFPCCLMRQISHLGCNLGGDTYINFI